MLPRLQRNLAAIEIFALVIWVGGLTFLLLFAEPALARVFKEDADGEWRALGALLKSFGSVQVILASVVLASNFLKQVLFRGIWRLQRLTLLACAIMLMLAIGETCVVLPKLDDRRAAVASLVAEKTTPGGAAPAVGRAADALARRQFSDLRSQQRAMAWVSLAMGMFVVYSYHRFEERKLQVLAGVISQG